MKSILTLTVTGITLAFAAPEARANELARRFEAAFFSDRIYEENRCGENVERFLRSFAGDPRLLDEVRVIEIVNRGIYNFGLVGAQVTRQGYSMNWGHHVVVYDGEKIYDFDFGPRPEPVAPAEYVARNFITDSMRRREGACRKEIGEFEFSFYRARDYLDYMGRRGRRKAEDVRLKDLPEWGCESPVANRKFRARPKPARPRVRAPIDWRG